jgi:uroporphyrinogen decarboxylase
MTGDVQNLFLRTLAGEKSVRPPIWLMRQAGRYLPEYRAVRATTRSFLDFCYTPEKAAEVTLQPIRRFGFDAAILFSDILVIPDALGRKVEFLEGEGPRLEPIENAAAVAALDPVGVVERLSPVMETVQRVRSGLVEGETALIGFAGAPWTVATYMIAGRGGTDKADVRLWAYRHPEMFEALLAVLVEATSAYLIAQIEAGAQAVQLFDSWSDQLPSSFFDQAVIQPTRSIVDRVRAAAPGVPIIGFPRGAASALARYQRETRVTAVALDTGADLAATDAALPVGVPVQGNLDPMAMIVGGEVLAREADRIIAALAERPHVFNLGHGITPEASPEHVAALVRRVRGA